MNFTFLDKLGNINARNVLVYGNNLYRKHDSCADPENAVRDGGPNKVFFFVIVFFVMNIFHRGPYIPPS